MCNYVFNALEALGVRWGLSHCEVIAETSPQTGEIRIRLIEINCRQHNTDFMPLTNACVGYNALWYWRHILATMMTATATTAKENFRGIPFQSYQLLEPTVPLFILSVTLKAQYLGYGLMYCRRWKICRVSWTCTCIRNFWKLATK